MIKLRKIPLDTLLVIAIMILFAAYYLLLFFNSPWENTGVNIHQIPNDNILIKGIPFFTLGGIILLAILLAMERKFPFQIVFPIILLCIFGAVWIAYSILFQGKSLTVIIRTNFPPTIMFIPILILVGYEDKWWPLIKKMIFIIACVFTFYSFYECSSAAWITGDAVFCESFGLDEYGLQFLYDILLGFLGDRFCS